MSKCDPRVEDLLEGNDMRTTRGQARAWWAGQMTWLLQRVDDEAAAELARVVSEAETRVVRVESAARREVADERRKRELAEGRVEELEEQVAKLEEQVRIRYAATVSDEGLTMRYQHPVDGRWGLSELEGLLSEIRAAGGEDETMVAADSREVVAVVPDVGYLPMKRLEVVEKPLLSGRWPVAVVCLVLVAAVMVAALVF